MKKQSSKVLIFGTFDGIHPGHLHFIKEAQKLGDLYISIASDESIETRKMHAPVRNALKRLTEMKKLKIAKSVSVGDKILGGWTDIKRITPDIIAIGYDQTGLEKALLDAKNKLGFTFSIKKISAFEPKKYHSSILNKSKIKNQKSKTCVYCTIPVIKERMIAENKLAWAFPTNIPIVPGHILIVPKRCVRTYEEMTVAEQKAIFDLTTVLKKALTKAFGAAGFNFAWNEGRLAGQSVPHFHLHVLPRKENDTGIKNYEPRKFIYRPGDREASPEKELQTITKLIKANIK